MESDKRLLYLTHPHPSHCERLTRDPGCQKRCSTTLVSDFVSDQITDKKCPTSANKDEEKHTLTFCVRSDNTKRTDKSCPTSANKDLLQLTDFFSSSHFGSDQITEIPLFANSDILQIVDISQYSIMNILENIISKIFPPLER